MSPFSFSRLHRLHNGDNAEIKKYFVSFWNGVDLRYKLLKGPKVRISIAGIIISRVRKTFFFPLHLYLFVPVFYFLVAAVVKKEHEIMVIECGMYTGTRCDSLFREEPCRTQRHRLDSRSD
jgi:hypothetical protein